jgi:glycosyltransferase involved in cell wall biosynthesis
MTTSNPVGPISVIVPAFNEAESIAAVVDHIRTVLNHARIPHELIVIDDGSTDNTGKLAKQAGARVLHHRRNRGYGASLKSGILAARNGVVVIMDADGTYPAERIPDFLEKLQQADIVVGQRSNIDIPLLRRPAKWILRHLAQHITGERIPDLNSGMRAFHRSLVLQYFGVVSDRFSFTTTLTVAALCDNFTITYLPIEYHPRVGKSKIVPWDFINFIILILRLSMLFNPLKVFVPVSMFCFAAGLVKLGLDVYFAELRSGVTGLSLITQPIVSSTTMIFLISGLQLLMIGMMSDGLARKISLLNPQEYRSRAIEDTSE